MINEDNLKQCTEVQIKVPWGHISGKWWGPQTVRPILAIHGWQDNAGTFDTLIPLLPDHISILAIDLPGHGLSSRIPNGLLYHSIDYVYVLRLIMKEYNWDKISIMGHSLGSVMGFWFASMYPDEIEILIGIDALKPTLFPLELQMPVMARIMDGSLLANERNRNESEPPSYSYEDCIERVYVGTGSSIDKDKCPILLTRNIQKSSKYPEKYYFTRDSRIKYINPGIWPQELYLDLTGKMKKPFLYINALDSRVNDKMENYQANMAMLKSNPLFEYHEVDGRHHVHLNNPEPVSEIINSFLMKHIPPNSNIKAKL